ncbi:uncharacterized protein RJT20DRAFT_141981 [Scheffersomyces xylosifermentans]|uniref:uncharacterized protein n=1 Tax=Scheffersomyces xylosifermentans TaxID=1304137 RepID=UPI00315C7188
MPDKPRGILRNKSVTSPEVSPHDTKVDRQEVIKNTRLNAEIASKFSSEGDKIRAEIARKRSIDGSPEHSSEHLQWDELNLYKTEQEKSSTMKIDEPKTPYEGGFNPEGEYYKDDDEAENDDIPDFELGEGEYDTERAKHTLESLHGSEVIKDPEYEEEEDDEDQEKELTAEERHKRFEQMRKEHYHLRGNALHHQIDLDKVPDDEEDDEKDKDEADIEEDDDDEVEENEEELK